MRDHESNSVGNVLIQSVQELSCLCEAYLRFSPRLMNPETVFWPTHCKATSLTQKLKTASFLELQLMCKSSALDMYMSTQVLTIIFSSMRFSNWIRPNDSLYLYMITSGSDD